MLIDLNKINKKVITFSKGIYHNKSLQNLFNNNLVYKPKIILPKSIVIGWGEKENTQNAKKLAKRKNFHYLSIEDGFIRSVGLGVQGAPSCSFVADKLGIYYDTRHPSTLENILQSYDFQQNKDLIDNAKQAIALIKKYKISKYNLYPDIKPERIKSTKKHKVLIIGQTANDLSLKYGHGDNFSTEEIFEAVKLENPNSDIYVKVHPDVLEGEKESDIDLSKCNKKFKIISDLINPISLLNKFDKVYTKTSQMGFEALLLRKKVVCFGLPFYAGWGLTDDRVHCARRTRRLTVEELFAGAYILYSHYYNPYTNRKSDIVDIIYAIKRHSAISINNSCKSYFFNFDHWKHHFIRQYMNSYTSTKIHFCHDLNDARLKGLDENSRIYIWGKKWYSDVNRYSKNRNIPICRVEDGFYRSLMLGCYLTKPGSLLFDRRDIHFDPTKITEIELILSKYNFEGHIGLRQRAENLRKLIINNHISKYNSQKILDLTVPEGGYDKVILITGQVATDASIRYGGCGMTNKTLIIKVRKENPNAYIIYKPHPDVLTCLTKGHLPDDFLEEHCDKVVKNICIDSCIQAVDEVHVISSMCGFEALIRNKKVVVYGLPFYAGWGLTHDKKKIPKRHRKLSIDELIAGAIILYPRYIHPKTNELCEVEAVIEEIIKERNQLSYSKFYSLFISLLKFYKLFIIFLITVSKGNIRGILKFFGERLGLING
ncbi:MAG: capsular polysaccharide biosynthesis protein [bacterium]|nr:capsular polysaccharide biosynthesis protein [bacterium]